MRHSIADSIQKDTKEEKKKGKALYASYSNQNKTLIWLRRLQSLQLTNHKIIILPVLATDIRISCVLFYFRRSP